LLSASCCGECSVGLCDLVLLLSSTLQSAFVVLYLCFEVLDDKMTGDK
jgi:hypothetical protein